MGGTAGERPATGSQLLRTLGAVFRAGLLAVLDALRIEHAAKDVVTDTGKVANTAAADEHNRVLLQVVAFARNVGDDFAAVRQTNLGDFTKCRVRLLRRRRINARANTAFLRVLLHCRDLGFGLLRSAALADQLVDSWHCFSLRSLATLPGAKPVPTFAEGIAAYRHSPQHERKPNWRFDAQDEDEANRAKRRTPAHWQAGPVGWHKSETLHPVRLAPDYFAGCFPQKDSGTANVQLISGRDSRRGPTERRGA